MKSRKEPDLAGTASPPPIDLERLAALLGDGDETRMFGLLEIFRDLFPEMLADIGKAIDERDARRLHDAAHKAKSAANSAAAPAMIDLLAQLERDAILEDWQDFFNRWGVIQSEYTRIEDFCSGHEGQG